MKIDGHAQGLGPKMCIDGARPVVDSMQKHGVSMFDNVVNAAFNLTILMVSTNATKGDGLSRSVDSITEQVVCKLVIASVISYDLYYVRVGKALKGFFCLKHFLGSVQCSHMHVGEVSWEFRFLAILELSRNQASLS